MGVIVAYTHTDMEDVWIPFFGQNKKYLSEYKKYIFVNKPNDNIPEEYIPIYYDEFKPYTERLKECLSQIDEDVFLFTHEDMILFNEPKYDLIEKYYGYVSDKLVDSVKLIYASDGCSETKFEKDTTLVNSQYSKFSIQPTIISKDVLTDILNKVESLNIWDFENAIKGTDRDYMVRF